MSRSALAGLVLVIRLAWSQDGSAIFQKQCVVCHRAGNENRAPLVEALRGMPVKSIVTALETGSMKAQGAALSAEERSAVAKFLSGGGTVANDGATGACAAGTTAEAGLGEWNGWGIDLSNSRFQPAKVAKLTADQIPKLKLKWAFGFPNANSAISQPALVAGKLYFGSQNGTIYSVDAQTGCVYWTFKADATTRAAISLGTLSGGRAAMFTGDTQANVYALDPRSGALLWRAKVEDHKLARVTGAPKLVNGRLYVPVASSEEVSPGNASYPCCTFRGSIVALDAATGKQLWKSYTIPDPPGPTKKNSAGTQLSGPAGAAVWLSPTIDPDRKLIYVGTGNHYSDPATKYSDAVIAYDLETGSMKWVQQLTGGDGWNFACMNQNKANCPEVNGQDLDIGASPILVKRPGGKALLLVGQKSGVVHALDPDAGGKIVWQTRIGKGSALGGIQWGMAANAEIVYAAVSDRNPRNPELEGGLFALKIDTGEKVWQTPAPRPQCTGRPGCSAAQMAPVTLIPGVVFSGSIDGHLRAYAAADGAVIWDLDTLKDFETVNGVKARGGSLSASGGPVIAGGMLYVNSGYGALGGMAGNVLLAFGLD